MRLFILGAGVSKSCGGSLAKDLLADAIHQSKARGQHVRMIRGIDDLLSYAFPNFEQKSGKYPHIEEVLSLFDTWMDFNSKIQDNPRFSDYQISEVRRWILRVVADNLNIISSKKNIQRTSPISRFALSLKPKDVVITFNWDLSLERALDEYTDIGWDYSFSPKGKEIALLKAHGSIDWYQTEDIYKVPKDDKEPLDPDVGYISLIKWWEPRRVGRSREIAPYIIAPTYFKRFQAEEIRNIWNNMYLALSQAKKITILGYSLPPQDLQARIILRSAIEQNKNERAAGAGGIVTVINPSVKTKKTFRQLGFNLRFVQEKFENVDFSAL